MRAVKKTFLMALSLGLIALGTLHAQAPTGAIAGLVTDPAEAAMAIIRYSSPTPTAYPANWPFGGGVAFTWPVTVARNACPF